MDQQEEKVFKLNDLFWTFQGEGMNWGRRALFVRLPFCNLKCSWCDTEFNSFNRWEESLFEQVALSELGRFAVITGGEPMMNKQVPEIVRFLKKHGFEIACETNGTFPIYDGIDFVTCSPKRDANYEVHPETLPKISELKLVVDEGFDFAVAKNFERLLAAQHTRLTLSPEFNKMSESFTKIEQFIKENPLWRVSLQTHKWLKIK